MQQDLKVARNAPEGVKGDVVGGAVGKGGIGIAGAGAGGGVPLEIGIRRSSGVEGMDLGQVVVTLEPGDAFGEDAHYHTSAEIQFAEAATNIRDRTSKTTTDRSRAKKIQSSGGGGGDSGSGGDDPDAHMYTSYTRTASLSSGWNAQENARPYSVVAGDHVTFTNPPEGTSAAVGAGGATFFVINRRAYERYIDYTQVSAIM